MIKGPWPEAFLLLMVLCMGCSAGPLISPPAVSGVDSRYQRQRWNQSHSGGTSSPGVSFYQTILRRTLSSHCTLYPSDSVYAQDVTRGCGSLNSMVRSMGRFYLEPDAPHLGMAMTQVERSRLYVDLAQTCDLF